MTTYSISLDDVDLALLPLRTHKYNDFLKKEHYQFQVMKIDNIEEPEPTVLYTCHICAVQVPAAFAREHAASVKHRANARIASVAAQRTRALITALPPPYTNQPSARFCANCSTLVGRNHDKTKDHRVAVMHDKLLWELMTAYIGDDDGANSYEDSELSDTDDFGAKEENGYRSQTSNGFGKWKSKGNSEAEEQKKFDSTLAVKEIETDKKEAKKNNDIQNQDLKHNDVFETWASKVKNNHEEKQKRDTTLAATTTDTVKKELDNRNEARISELTHIETVNDGENTEITTNDRDFATSSKPKTQDDIKIEYFEFVTKDNKQAKVFSDHYHSFTRKVDTITCKVCSSSFKTDDVYSHMFSLKHLNKMPSTMIDEHCVRKIDDTYSHCILCNQMVKNTNVAKHCLTIGHNQREKQVLTENTNYNHNQASTSKMDNNTNLDTAQPATKTVNGDVKVKPQPKVAEKVNPTGETKSSIDWPVIYPYEVTTQGNTVRCVICDCQVPNNPENRKDHLLGQNHAKNVKNKRPFYPYENTKQDGVARCVVCDVKVIITPDDLKEHLTGLSHARNVIRRQERPPTPRASTSKQPTPAPAQVTQPAAVKPTYKSTSDTIQAKSTNYYFSWI